MLIKRDFFLLHKKKIIVGALLVVIVAGISTGAFLKFGRRQVFAKEMQNVTQKNYAEATSGDIYLSITSSGAIESSNVKNITSEVSAKVKSVNVKVGDKVSKGDVLFELDSSDLDAQIRNKQKSITSYNKQITNYEKSIKNYNENISEYNDDITNLNVYADKSGYVQNLKSDVGDSISKNSVLFNIIVDDNYVLKANFNYFEKSPINVGDSVTMLVVDSFATLEGTVSKVSDLKTQSEFGGQLEEVEIILDNPGYTLEGVNVFQISVLTQNGVTIISDNQKAIEAAESKSFKVESSGTIKELLVSNGSYVNAGDLVAVLENSDLSDKIADTNDSIKDVYSSISEVKSNISDVYSDIKDLKEDYSFYTITSPIDGIITSVSVNDGDYVRSESTIAKVVNTDVLRFEISVDELDILKLNIGQEAKITIDAITETETNPIIGSVTEIGLEGTNMNSVTSYPVVITFEGREDIKMGMNCSVEIIVDKAENVITIPVEAVNSRKGKYFVTLEDGTQKEVEIGLYDEDSIEIKSGLSVGDKVELPIKVVATTSATQEKQEQGFNIMGGGMPGGSFGGGSMPGGGGSSRGSSSGRSSNGGSRGGF